MNITFIIMVTKKKKKNEPNRWLDLQATLGRAPNLGDADRVPASEGEFSEGVSSRCYLATWTVTHIQAELIQSTALNPSVTYLTAEC